MPRCTTVKWVQRSFSSTAQGSCFPAQSGAGASMPVRFGNFEADSSRSQLWTICQVSFHSSASKA